ncbi:Uncharacterized protein AC517_0165 [Pseudomonas syringae pv. syringae]|nr:Uncharacterized protein AC517_0165 [Pseudomonas syringae pv. syringae]
MGIKQVDAGVGHRFADGRVATAFAAGHSIMADISRGARNGCLGWTIGVDQASMRRAHLVPELELLRRQRITRDVDQAHLGQALFGSLRLVVPLGHQRVPVRGGQVQDRRMNAVSFKTFVAEDLAARSQGGTRQQGREDFLHRQVKVQGVLLQHGVGWRQAKQPRRIDAVVDQAAMFDHHALRIARGARGVDHICQIAHAEGFHHRVVVTLGKGFALIAVEQHQWQGQGRQALAQITLGQQRRWLAVGDHVSQSLGRIGRVQRYISRPCLEHTEQADHHFHTALDADRHPVVRADAQADQVMSQTVGLTVQFGIAQALRLVDHGDSVGLYLDLFFEQLVNRAVLRVRHIGSIKVDQQMLALRLIEQRHLLQQLAVVGDHGFQQALEVAHVTLQGAFVEQCRGIFQRADQLIADLGHVQRQVELGRMASHCDALQAHVAKRQIGCFVVLPRQHGLENRAVGQAALWANHLNHLFERQVLIRLGGQGLLFDLLQQALDARCPREVDAHGQGVDEEPDQVLHLGTQAVGHRRTDDHVVLTGQTSQQRSPCGHDRHEQAAAMPLAQRL